MEELEKLRSDYNNFITLYIKCRLYFEEELCEIIEKINHSMSDMIDKYIESIYSKGDGEKRYRTGSEMIETHKIFRQKCIDERRIIESAIRKILSAEIPNNELDKKQ